MTRRTLTVSGMTCGGCEQNVEDVLAALDGVTRIEADTVELHTQGDVADDESHAAVTDAGCGAEL